VVVDDRRLDAEVAGVVALVRSSGARLVNVGHGRDRASVRRARRFLRVWLDGGVETGAEVGEVVSWPATAASWLRPARRLASGAPDAWVVADQADAWAKLCVRLAATAWRADRTFCFPGLDQPKLVSQIGADLVEGMRGIGDGGRWAIVAGELRRLG